MITLFQSKSRNRAVRNNRVGSHVVEGPSNNRKYMKLRAINSSQNSSDNPHFAHTVMTFAGKE